MEQRWSVSGGRISQITVLPCSLRCQSLSKTMPHMLFQPGFINYCRLQSTQCQADLHPGTADPLSVKRIYAPTRIPRPHPPNGLHVWHGIPAVHHLQRQQQLRASLASAVIDPIKGLGLCHNGNRKGGALLPVFRQ